LTPAYHARVDVPQAVAAMATDRDVRAAAPLGPHPLLLTAVEELLADAGVRPDPGTSVVVYAAGSSDSAAVASVGRTLADHPPQGWGPWVVAALDGGDRLGQALDRVGAGGEVVAVAFMVAEGILRDRMAAACDEAGIRLVPGALSATDALARLALERADSLRW